MERSTLLFKKCYLALACTIPLLFAPLLQAQTTTAPRVLFEAVSREGVALPPGSVRSIGIRPSHASTTAISESEPSEPELPVQNSELADIQTTKPSQRLSEIAHYRDLMEAQIEEGGAFASGLIQSQLALGDRYQELKLHESAIEAFDDARHLIRVQQGLDAMEQGPLIEKAIQSHLVLGELEDALKLHQTLAELNLGDSQELSNLELAEAYLRVGDSYQRSADVLHDTGTSQRFEISRFLENNPGMDIRTVDAVLPDNTQRPKKSRVLFTGEEVSVVFSTPALENYTKAIRLLIEAQAFSHPRLVDIEHMWMRSVAARYGSRLSYRKGGARSKIADALQRVVSYEAYSPDTTLAELAARMFEVGDWHLYTVKSTQAQRQYADTLNLLSQLNVASAEALRLANPPVPLEIPAMFPSAHSRAAFRIPSDAVLHYDGYIDVDFSITKYGRTGKIEITDKTANVDPQLEKTFLNYLANARFRPAIDSEGKIKNHEVHLRYYFDYPVLHTSNDTLVTDDT